MAMPLGWLKVAAAPVPGALPALPEPANTLTTPVVLALYIRWLATPVKYRFPAASPTISHASVMVTPEVVNVVTSPEGLILRILLPL